MMVKRCRCCYSEDEGGVGDFRVLMEKRKEKEKERGYFWSWS